jgi:multiple sugar transport system permease protein
MRLTGHIGRDTLPVDQSIDRLILRGKAVSTPGPSTQPVASSAVAPSARRRGWGALRRRQALDGYLLAAPAILGLLIFTAYPVIYTFYLSFTEYTFVKTPTWIGLANYQDMVGDELFRKSLLQTFYYCALSIPLTLIGSFLVAILLNQGVHGISFYRTIWYLPALVPAAAAAALWRWILNRDFGIVNELLYRLGLPTPGWLVEPEWTIPTLALVAFWTGLGSTMLIFLAGLQGVPTHLYEAAALDGASAWRRLWNVTIPMMSPIIFFNLVLGVIGSFQAFTTVYLIYTPTGSGSAGPSDSGMLYLVYLYRNAFQYFRVGYAAALSWVLFMIIVLLTLFLFRMQRRWVYYESEAR